MLRRNLIAVLAIAALALPAAAIAKNDGNHGKKKGHRPHKVGYVFKGFYAGDSSVDVKRGNSRVRKGKYINKIVEFDLTGARIVVADTNQDGKRNLEDVQEGDWVLVKSRLPRKDPGAEPFDARRLIDRSHYPKRTGNSKGRGKN